MLNLHPNLLLCVCAVRKGFDETVEVVTSVISYQSHKLFHNMGQCTGFWYFSH